jgi:hypothetical protein
LKKICVVGVVHDELDLLKTMMVADTSINDGDGYFDEGSAQKKI